MVPPAVWVIDGLTSHSGSVVSWFSGDQLIRATASGICPNKVVIINVAAMIAAIFCFKKKGRFGSVFDRVNRFIF